MAMRPGSGMLLTLGLLLAQAAGCHSACGGRCVSCDPNPCGRGFREAPRVGEASHDAPRRQPMFADERAADEDEKSLRRSARRDADVKPGRARLDDADSQPASGPGGRAAVSKPAAIDGLDREKDAPPAPLEKPFSEFDDAEAPRTSTPAASDDAWWQTGRQPAKPASSVAEEGRAAVPATTEPPAWPSKADVEPWPFQGPQGRDAFSRRESVSEPPPYPHAPQTIEKMTRTEIVDDPPAAQEAPPSEVTRTGRIEGLFALPTIHPGPVARTRGGN